jgi:hypothetical protein
MEKAAQEVQRPSVVALLTLVWRRVSYLQRCLLPREGVVVPEAVWLVVVFVVATFPFPSALQRSELPSCLL